MSADDASSISQTLFIAVPFLSLVLLDSECWQEHKG